MRAANPVTLGMPRVKAPATGYAMAAAVGSRDARIQYVVGASFDRIVALHVCQASAVTGCTADVFVVGGERSHLVKPMPRSVMRSKTTRQGVSAPYAAALLKDGVSRYHLQSVVVATPRLGPMRQARPCLAWDSMA